MNEPNRIAAKTREHARRIFGAGIIATVIYAVGMLTYASYAGDAMLAMKPEEFATFLSGVFAPLAFPWLVLGFIQQGEELRNSAEALRLQEEELHNLVDQQSELVTVTRDQLKYQQDRAEAAEAEARRLAQPTLVLKGGTSRTSGESPGKLVRTFHLENVGTTCTLVSVDFDGLRKTERYGSLTNGAERSFDLTFDLDSFDEATILVGYTDARGEPGQKQFRLRKKGRTVNVKHTAN